MEDLTAKVQEILGSEEGMKQLQDMAKMLGLTGEGENQNAPASNNGPDLSTLLSGLTGTTPGAGSSGGTLPISPADLAKLGTLLHSAQEDTPSAALLRALRPLLRENRQKRVDEALRIMRLLSLWPVLQQSGLLQGLLGDDSSHS